MSEELIEEMRGDEFEDLFKLTMEQKWEQVVEIYKKNPKSHRTKVTKSEETAFHIAISSYHSRIPRQSTHIEEMMEAMEEGASLLDVLSMQNERGDTALHIAAAVGSDSAYICQCIASRQREAIRVRNAYGETPLFIAAHHGNLQAFLCLHELYRGFNVHQSDLHEPLRRTRDGDTVLHSAISGEYFRLAYQIICYHPTLINSINVDGESPLYILARKPNVFKCSNHLQFFDSILYHCMFVDELKIQKYDSRTSQNPHFSKHKYLPGNYRTCADIFSLFWVLILIITGGFLGRKKRSVDPSDEENQQHGERTPAMKDEKSNIRSSANFFPPNYTTCVELFKFAMTVILTILGVGFGRIKKIKVKKERYSHALEVMNKMIEHESSYKHGSSGQRPDKYFTRTLSRGINIPIPNKPPLFDEHGAHYKKETDIGTTLTTNKAPQKIKNEKGIIKTEELKSLDIGLVKDTPVLLAAKTGILEMVKKIISKCPVAIKDLDGKGKNVLMVAAEHRQTRVFDYLLDTNPPEYMFHQLDDEENNILHLAAKLGQVHPWRIQGAALQMQWEIKWYKHVKRSLAPLTFAHPNLNGDTPRMVLTKTHKKLKKAGNEWLIKTSESCSVVAALIAAVAFATSSTVPGGLNQETGHPILSDHEAFDIFSITSLVALCLSVTALVFFLGIITSRCEERDFKTNLPRKLLMGLTCLFSSIAAMLLSFCAGHTFILREKLRIAAVPIYAFATIPVGFFAVAQLPLYFDLVWAACRKVPLRSYKVFYQ
ncbi:hypothetical protein C2S52_014988 [Perilla frutescens var. hirtella]|nr:hypothetical protein C2S52_014988 [Perilla frutescens var. hirtella]